MRRPGMAQLAQAAGLSVATVDRALNGRERVRPETLSHIIAVAQQIGHPAASRLNPAARPGGSRRFGVVLHKQGQEFYKAFAEELHRAVAGERSVEGRLVLDFSLSQSPTEMAGLLRQTVGPDIALALRPEPGCAPMLCDRAQLESALVNLALNARDAMLPRGGGTLTVTIETMSLAKPQLVGFAAARPGRFVCITMADTGTGMSEDVLARAFDPFFTTRPAGSGIGLGLSQVWGFVAQSGGVLRAVSAPGQGAIFHLYLPCAPGGPAPIPASTLPATPPCPHIPRALLVDDEPQVRDALAEALGDLGWHVQQAATGAEALEKLRAGPAPDILVADIGLPGGMNGRQLAEAARALHPALPILLITGYAGTALGPGRPLPEGAQLLHKPFTLGVLAGRVQALVSGQR